jgi:glyoxylase-like metal-dependent hydrolase (beta-lactamase superfamily II)
MTTSEGIDRLGIFAARADLVIPAGMAGPTEMSLDVRAFVINRGEGVVIVDTLMEPGQVGLILEAMGTAEVELDELEYIVLTHSHIDHTGGLASLVELAPDAQILCGAGDVESIHASTGLRPEAIGAGDRFAGLEVISTPGHTPGHLCLFDQGSSTMLLGDLAGNIGGLRRSPLVFTADPDLAEASLRAIAERHFDNAVPSHGDPVIGGADRAVVRLVASAT